MVITSHKLLGIRNIKILISVLWTIDGKLNLKDLLDNVEIWKKIW